MLVSREPNKLIIYRGWPAGERRPDMIPEDEKQEEVPPELRAAIVREEIRNPMDFSYLMREECALVGIEYRGNGNEENDEEGAESEQEDDANIGFDMWNDGRQYIEGYDDDDDDDGITEVGVDMWNGGKWYAEDEDEDKAEDEIWSSKLEGIEAD